MLTNKQEGMKEEILAEMAQGATLEEIKDRAGEWIDNHLPIYNHEIIKEWQEMPSEYDDQGAEFYGVGADWITIIRLMILDLHYYYSDLLDEVFNEIEQDQAVSA
jgi:hypothetical protein